MIDRDTHAVLTKLDPGHTNPQAAEGFKLWVTQEFGAHVLQAYYRTPLSGTYYR